MLKLKKIAVGLCAAASFLAAAADKSYQEDPAKYWDFSKLEKAPAYRPSGIADAQADGLEDILFDGVPFKGKPAPVFAYIGYPDTPMPKGGYPAVLLIHGGGGTAFPGYARMWVKQGFAVMAIDWYNCRPVKNAYEARKVKNKEPLPGGWRNHILTNVANMVLAHSLLRSLPKVNKDKTLFVGLSWGSWYGTAVTALDPRFKGAIEIYCGDINLKKKHLVNGRFVHAAKVPMYWICSTNDDDATPEDLQRSWDDCRNLVTKSIVIRLPHSHVGFRFPACWRMAHHFLNDAPSLPKISKISVENGVASAKVLNSGKGIVKSIFCYTTDRNQPVEKKRKWQSIPAELKDNVLSVKLPENVFMGYFSAYDETPGRFKDCCGSSDFYTFQPRDK